MTDHPLISFEEIQKGDHVISTRVMGSFVMTRQGHAHKKFTGGNNWGTAERVDLGGRECTWQLLHRPKAKGPAWDAKPFSFWRHRNGLVLVRADVDELLFIGTKMGFLYRGGRGNEDFVDKLVPYVP